MASSNVKIQEGLQLMKEAEKSLKTSFFKWSPDYDSAADRYNKAAVCFKVAKSYEKAIDAFLKAADSYEKNNQLFHAAKALSQAAGICVDLKRIEEAVSHMERACRLQREHGSPDSASSTLIKAAKMCENSLPQKAIELYIEAAELCDTDEKYRDAAGHLNNAVRLHLRNKRYLDATEVMKKQCSILAQVENFNNVYKIVLGIVLVYLSEGDYVAADKIYKDAFEYPGFGTSDEAEALEKLLDAYDSGDVTALKAVTSLPIITCQDIEIAKLGKLLKPPEGGGLSEFAGNDVSKETNESQSGNGNKPVIDDNELDEGIC